MLEGRAVIVKRLKALPLEAVVRGYLIGSGWKDYQATGAVCGIALPKGMQQAQQLPEPIFTPATKAEIGDHDENISFSQAEKLVGAQLAAQVRDTAIAFVQVRSGACPSARHHHRRHEVRVRARSTAGRSRSSTRC